MFWDKLIPKKYLVKSEICAVEACMYDDGLVYHYTYLKNKNNKLALVETGSCNNDLSLPLVVEKNKVPVLLVINGKGVIVKKISTGDDSPKDISELIQLNLPAFNTEDFYIQLYRQGNATAFLALCRKEPVEREIQGLLSKKHQLASLLIGAPAVIGLQPLWSSYNAISTSCHDVELTNNFLDVLTPADTKDASLLKIEDISITASHTLGFACGLSYFMQRHLTENISTKIKIIQTQHYEKNKIRFLTIAAIAFAFLLAIVNAGFYSAYFNRNNMLETELGVYQGKYEQINKLLNDYQKNKNLIENAGVLNKNKLSEYGDRIGKTLPDEVTLSELYFNPKNETDSEDSLVTFETKHLTLKGNCSKSFIVNEWVNVLKMQKFIKDVNLERFTYNNEGLLPNFEIKLVTE